MKTRCGWDEINIWECIQLEDNLPDDPKKINHLFFNQISDFGLDQRSEYSEDSKDPVSRRYGPPG